jgi:hypothetical protein
MLANATSVLRQFYFSSSIIRTTRRTESSVRIQAYDLADRNRCGDHAPSGGRRGLGAPQRLPTREAVDTGLISPRAAWQTPRLFGCKIAWRFGTAANFAASGG